MTECDYCGEEVDDDAYVEHLRSEHDDELGAIDRRRVEAATSSDGGLGGSRALYLLPVVGIAAVLVAFVLFSGGGGDGTAAGALPDAGDPALLEDVEQFPSEGNQHVRRGTEINYARMPPTSGPHYGVAAGAGFYGEGDGPSLGSLVHSLEHGAVVVYYDPAAMDPDARGSLEAFARAHTGAWKSVIVTPNPRDDPRAAYVLTAWRHRLFMTGYDEATVRAFLAEYLGRGPENPVR